MKNRLVAKILYEVAELLELQGVQFKPRAYRRAAQAVESSPFPVEDLAAQGRLEELPGVGASIATKIEEIVATGRLGYHEELKEALPVDLYALTRVEGVGPKTAKVLYETLGIRTLDDLERAAREGRIRQVPGLGVKTEERILRGIAEAKGREHRELLGYVLPLARDLVRKLASSGLFQRLEPAGSLRRGKETVGDLDILAVSDRPDQAVAAFLGLSEVEQILAQGPKKASVRLSGGFQVDLRVVPREAFGAALQYFTGSKEHNIRLRERAVARGLKLSEYGLFTEHGQVVAQATEEEIYEALGLVWVPPELREDQGEIAAAERRALPQLLTLQEVRSDLHVHTRWSDGTMDLGSLVRQAERRGLEYVAATDHLRFAQAIPGLSLDDLRRQVDEIQALKEGKPSVQVLAGVEANIGPDGAVDVPRELRLRLDWVVAGVHTHFRQGRAEMTRRLLRAVEEEAVDALAHPTGRLLGERAPYEADWDEVFRLAAQCGTALEVNANPQRLDLPPELIRRALEFGVKLALGTDAHAPEHLDFLEYGVIAARRGWAEAAHVLNTLPLERFLPARKR